MPGSIAPNRQYDQQAMTTLGDSRLAQAYVADVAAVTTRNAANFIHPSFGLMGQRLRLVNPQATSGLRSDQYMATSYVAAAFATNAYWLLTGGIVNDVSQFGNASDYWTLYIKPVCDAWCNQGRKVIVQTETGSTAMASSTANMGAVYRYNRQVRQHCMENPNAVLFDVQAAACDPTQVMAFNANTSGDGTHINLLQGAMTLANAFATLMTPLVPATSRLVRTVGEVYSRGGVQWQPNPLFLTTSGGAAVTGITGTMPAGVTGGTMATGHTASVSTTSGPVGNDLVMALTATQAGTSKLQFDLTSIGADVAGGIWDASAISVLSSGSSGFQGTTLHLESSKATSGVRYVEDNYTDGTASNGALSSAALTLQHQTDPLVTDTTTRNWLTLYANFKFAAAGSATVNLRQLGCFLRQ